MEHDVAVALSVKVKLLVYFVYFTSPLPSSHKVEEEDARGCNVRSFLCMVVFSLKDRRRSLDIWRNCGVGASSAFPLVLSGHARLRADRFYMA